jgi:hypothetical protein
MVICFGCLQPTQATLTEPSGASDHKEGTLDFELRHWVMWIDKFFRKYGHLATK